MLHKKSLIVVALSLLLSFGCKDNDIVLPDNNLSEKHISKIVTDAENYNIFLYSGQKLMKYESVQNNLTTQSISFRYQDDGKIESEEVSQNGQINDQRLYKYLYDDSGKVSQIEFFLKQGSIYKNSGKYICYYNQSNQLVKTMFTFNSQPSTQETQYSYYSDGNTKEKIRFIDGNLYDKITYEYDSKTNPISCLNLIAFCGMVVNHNNIVRTIVESTGEINRSETNYTYTYSEDGYPLNRIIEYLDAKNNNIKATQEYSYN